MNTPTAEKRAALEKWGLVAERIAADRELCAAIREVLQYEQQRIGVSPGMDDATLRWTLGERDGISTAFSALTDLEYIRGVRVALQTELKTETKED